MEDNKKNVLNNEPKKEEKEKKNKFLVWWLGLGKWAKVGVCAGAAAVLATAITLPIVLTQKNGGKPVDPQPTPSTDTYHIDWNTKKYNLPGEGEAKTLYELISDKDVSIKFFASDSTDGTLCGESDTDKVYFKLYIPESQNVDPYNLDVWAKKPIIFEDNDRGANNKGFFEEINIQSFSFNNVDTSRVTDMSNMFKGLYSLSGGLDLSSLDTSNVTKMANMFDCTSYPYGAYLKKIKVDETKFKVDKVLGEGGDQGVEMFKGQEAIIGGAGSRYAAATIDAHFAHIDDIDNPGYLTGEYGLYTQDSSYNYIDPLDIPLVTEPVDLDLAETTFTASISDESLVVYCDATNKKVTVTGTPSQQSIETVTIEVILQNGKVLHTNCKVRTGE